MSIWTGDRMYGTHDLYGPNCDLQSSYTSMEIGKQLAIHKLRVARHFLASVMPHIKLNVEKVILTCLRDLDSDGVTK